MNKPALFTPKQLRACKAKHQWTLQDRMPFGAMKGKGFDYLAKEHPLYVEYWANKHNELLSPQLREAIRISKFLNQ